MKLSYSTILGRKVRAILSWSMGQAALAAICFGTYRLFLFELVNIEITFIQWVAIVIIFACLMPGKVLSTLNKNKNER
jgi:hypothetical protein